MPNRPFQPLYGKKREDIGDLTRPIKKRKKRTLPEREQQAVQPKPTTPPSQVSQPLFPQKIPLTSLKQKAVNSLGELASFVDKRKTLLIIIIIILILLAVAIVAKRQEQQRKNLKMMRRRLKRLG